MCSALVMRVMFCFVFAHRHAAVAHQNTSLIRVRFSVCACAFYVCVPVCGRVERVPRYVTPCQKLPSFRWIPPPACPDLWLCRRSRSLLTQIWGCNRWQPQSLICGFRQELHKFLAIVATAGCSRDAFFGKFSSQSKLDTGSSTYWNATESSLRIILIYCNLIFTVLDFVSFESYSTSAMQFKECMFGCLASRIGPAASLRTAHPNDFTLPHWLQHKH